ncbi:hypothetical protein [Paenibacillus luteus]|uniref:hypothetical protein n=1 Tax=Paenibacillus luteus TaxID=2545753 RepID=UPI0011450B36|nr:hypothetical protein [Paenibacillus luteus]
MNKRQNNGDDGFTGLLGLILLGMALLGANKEKVEAFLEKAGIVAGKILTISIYVGISVLVLLITYKIVRAVYKAKKRKKERRIAALEKELTNAKADMNYYLELSVSEAFHFGLAEEIAERHDLEVSVYGPALFSETNNVLIGKRKVADIHEIELELYGYTETWNYDKNVVYLVTVKLNQNRFNNDLINARRNRTLSREKGTRYARS